MAQSKAWCFTDFKKLTDWSKVGASYCVVGVETCPKTGKSHLQGYLEFETNKRLSALKKIDPEAHFEPRKGTGAQAAEYCKKEKNWTEYGQIRVCEPGKRNDLKKIKEAVMEGAVMKDILGMEDITFPGIKVAEAMLPHFEPKRAWETEVYWLHGSTGSGKTKWAMEQCTDPWISGKNLRWWQGYDGHEDVIIDDFRKDFCTFHELLRILDRYPYTVEVKGGSRQLRAKRIFITCPWHPEDLYDGKEDVGQLLRRITHVRQFGSPVPRRGKCDPIGMGSGSG